MAQSTAARVFIGGLAHETHSFAVTPTTCADFEAYEWVSGIEMISHYGGTRTSIGGILDGAETSRLDVAPGFYSFAIPSGPVPSDDYEQLVTTLLASLEQRDIEAAILVLHGAMMAEGVGDVEGDVLRRVRAVVGDDVPVVATLDFHANITVEMVSTADCLIGYDTYPHVDAYERGVEAAQITNHLIRGDVQPVRAFASVPVLSVPQTQNTDNGPLANVFTRAHDLERDASTLTITVAGGFCYTDAPGTGMAVVVTTDGDSRLATDAARELQQLIWGQRASFVARNTPVSEAVRLVGAAPTNARPTILVDVADNIGGGAPGDGTAILAEILDQGVAEVAIVIADAEAVSIAFEASIGGTFQGRVGGKTDNLHGDPVHVTGRVRTLTDGEFVYRGSYMTGQVRQMGRTAVVDAGGNHLVLTERKTMPFDDQQLRSVGISPEYCRAIVVKSATAWRAAYEQICGHVIEVETPGICTVDLQRLPFEYLTRPIFPLDPDQSITLPEVTVL